MKATLKMPRVSDTVDEVTVVEWKVAVGDVIAEGDPLLAVDAEKAVVEVPSPVSGTVVELLADIDADIVTGTPILVVES